MGKGAAGGGSGPVAATSRSIVSISASASAVRPFASRQRGDSGSALRRYQTISAPMLAIKKSGRQPKLGIRAHARIAVTGRPEMTTKTIKAIHLPRRCGETGHRAVADKDPGAETGAHYKAESLQDVNVGREGGSERREPENHQIELIGKAPAEVIAEKTRQQRA